MAQPLFDDSQIDVTALGNNATMQSLLNPGGGAGGLTFQAENTYSAEINNAAFALSTSTNTLSSSRNITSLQAGDVVFVHAGVTFSNPTVDCLGSANLLTPTGAAGSTADFTFACNSVDFFMPSFGGTYEANLQQVIHINDPGTLTINSQLSGVTYVGTTSVIANLALSYFLLRV